MIWWPLRCVNLLKPLVFTLPGTMEFFEKNGFPGWTAIPVFILELVCGGFLMARLSPEAGGRGRTHPGDDLWIHVDLAPRWVVCLPGGGVAAHAFLDAAPSMCCALLDW